MSLDHAMDIFGVSKGTFSPSDIKPGYTVTKVQWDGCMATERTEIDIGEVIKHQPSPHNNGRYPGVLIKYDICGVQWEPMAHFRKVNGSLEVWS